MTRRTGYTAGAGEPLRLNEDQCDFVRRRTSPFLDAIGINMRTVPHLLQEAYLQGLRDAAEVINEKIKINLRNQSDLQGMEMEMNKVDSVSSGQVSSPSIDLPAMNSAAYDQTAKALDDLAAAALKVKAQRDLCITALKMVCAAYDAEYWMRTADVHEASCRCLRCATDNARAALSKALGQ